MAKMMVVPPESTKKEKYETLLPQLKSLIESETHAIANMANISAALKEVFSFLWVGFYLVEEEELILGPFQGSIACTRIKYGRGVCGTAWKEQQAIIVPDVERFPGHIACSSLSKSEIVIPIFQNGKVVAVLDVDSEQPAHFDKTDEKYLSKVAEWIRFS